MNTGSVSKISFDKAVEGYLLAAHARHLSQNTINDYVNTFRKFDDFLESVLQVEEMPIAKISSKQIEAFLAMQEVSNKTILNYHTGLSALWTWCLEDGLVQENIVQKVERPKPEKRDIKPYSEADVRAMLSVVTKSARYSRRGKRESQHKVTHPERNRAIILLLLDTGIRASELCDLKIHHLDLRNQRISVFGKGSKERTLPFCARTGKTIWHYLALRKEEGIGTSLFTSRNGSKMTRDQLLKALVIIGERAGVYRVNVHRFRHTFAINYLRNGGDAYSLQMMLGHSTMEMVKRYLALAQADLERNHKIASPVDNWRL